MHIRPPQAKSLSSYPRFDPHITLSAFPAMTDISLIRNAIPANQARIPVTFKSVDVGPTYFRSVYAACRPSAQLLELHKAIHERIKMEPNTPSFPHMSMFYIDDSEPEERTRIRDELVSQGKIRPLDGDAVELDCGEGDVLRGFEGGEIWIAKCEGPVSEWQVLERIFLL
ncbi:LigT-like protein [Gloeophyllum trabeum ATCC 11539]|uniref:LigT-like protein n=1 Tax=Gloeophyllum trabeum (strain ATCC 11539 / FP-39264 / Madison 617) TaxID=670483 RepID=S7QDS3_GLOTA|nr:LigT-like protein [Gloeophyllum trabeum ATCC 11539]EPQ57976.1 LigT-like protein [Gloeophyllum trabeum ATCC 11539]